MKYRLGASLVLGLVVLLMTAAEASQSVNNPPGPCPPLDLTINSVVVTPTTPAQQHVVNLSWSSHPPFCFNLSGVEARGSVTFGNGQIREFDQRFPANQFGAHIPVSGITNVRPIKIVVKLEATAVATVTGNSSFPSGLTFESDCKLPVYNVQAAMTGLVPVPNRPGQDFNPKVRVQWQTLPAPCQRVNLIKIDGVLIYQGKSTKFSQMVGGNQTSVETTITSVTVGSNFVPDQILAKVTASGQATISQTAKKDLPVN